MFTDAINKCAAKAARIVMTLFALSWFGQHSDTYTLSGIGHNLGVTGQHAIWFSLYGPRLCPLTVRQRRLRTVKGHSLGYWYATPRAQRPEAEKTTMRQTT